MEIGFIGLGKMGFPMARRLVEAGHQLTVFDTRKEAADKLLALGARRARLADSIFKEPSRHCEERSDEAIHSSFTRRDGLLRGACHRARIRATRWLAMTAS